MARRILEERLPSTFASPGAMESAWVDTDRFLADLPSVFSATSSSFYSTLGQRNLSGFIGEVFKSALHNHAPWLEPNPHPDGRPDLLDLRTAEAVHHYVEECHDVDSHLPLKSHLTPFRYGGFEVKCTVGLVPRASDFPVGVSRVDSVRQLAYWAHHRHACKLVALYYDYEEDSDGSPGIKAIFFAEVSSGHWAEVSTGRPGGKKTSNTQLLKPGIELLKNGLIGYDTADDYVAMLRRIGVTF